MRQLISEVATHQETHQVKIKGWIVSKREHGDIIFLDVEDRSGSIQVIAKRDRVGENTLEIASNVHEESSVELSGEYKPENNEIHLDHIKIVSEVLKPISPKPRAHRNLFSEEFHDVTLSNRHIYNRNRKYQEIIRSRGLFINTMHQFLRERDFTEYTAPILTPLTLYDTDTAFSVDLHGEEIYLTQCTAFYLEAALPSFERVFYTSPTFRAEKSRSQRHLSEYWHTKGEIAFYDLDELKELVTELVAEAADSVLSSVDVTQFDIDRDSGYYSQPFDSITYSNAVEHLHESGMEFEWGRNLGSDEESLLGELFDSPFWIEYLPRSIEPFPYMINPADDRTTLTADLIIPGYGEVLGTAEKIHTSSQLERRMEEDWLPLPHDAYEWYVELRDLGLPPHSGFGMGVERMLRCFLELNHVRDAVPHPRLYPRSPRV